jgi:Protein of unknown function (DUF3592)
MSLKARHIINILCVPVILSGIYTCFQGIETIKIANETSSWKTGTGTITYAGVKESPSTGKYKTVYRKPVINYTYIANKRIYQGNTIYWGDEKSPDQVSYTSDVIAKYKTNKQVVVYYNPLDPQKSVLEIGTSEVTFVSLVYGGILIFVGTSLPILFFVFRKSPTGSMEFKSWK